MAVILNKTNPVVAPATFTLKTDDFPSLTAPYTLAGNIYNVDSKCFYKGRLHIDVFGRIEKIEKCDVPETCFIIPGFIDSHVHIESSMVMPSEFAKTAVKKGVIATVCDPHEIANVLGIDGVEYFMKDGESSGFNFFFAAPSCVPASPFESSGAVLDTNHIKTLLAKPKVKALGEMMNYPGVINNNNDVISKIDAAKAVNKPVDGHAPTLTGNDLKKYVSAGITTDHECMDICEAQEKISLGMKVIIREGSAAKDFEALYPLINQYPSRVMLCTDDIHPDDMQECYIDSIVRRALNKRLDFSNVIQAASVNPVNHYNLQTGLLREGDPADFIVIDNTTASFKILTAYINGKQVFDGDKVNLHKPKVEIRNNFEALPIDAHCIKVTATDTDNIRVINVNDKELYTQSSIHKVKCVNGNAVSDTQNDILKLVVINRYSQKATPAIGFIKGFGLKSGAICSTVAHDSHNIIAVGADDESIVAAINAVIKSKGGICTVNNDNTAILELPIAGIISAGDINTAASGYHNLSVQAKSMGSQLTAPFMTLAFMSLSVIPELKLSDKGLFNSVKFEFTNLIVK